MTAKDCRCDDEWGGERIDGGWKALNLLNLSSIISFTTEAPYVLAVAAAANIDHHITLKRNVKIIFSRTTLQLW